MQPQQPQQPYIPSPPSPPRWSQQRQQSPTYSDWPAPRRPPPRGRPQWPVLIGGALAGLLVASALVGVGVLFASGRLSGDRLAVVSAPNTLPR
jgi:hypothetical protein